jgi:hypothetical protein
MKSSLSLAEARSCRSPRSHFPSARTGELDEISSTINQINLLQIVA